MRLRVSTQGVLVAVALLSPGFATAADGCPAVPAVKVEDSRDMFLKFLREVDVPPAGQTGKTGKKDEVIDGTLVGGLSGLDYDEGSKTWAIASDDASEFGPPGEKEPPKSRFYLAPTDPATGAPNLTPGYAHAVPLQQADGTPYPRGAAEPESIRFAPSDPSQPSGTALWWSSESQPSPFVRETDRDGVDLAELKVPAMFTMDDERNTGPSNGNYSFEGLSFTPSGAMWVSMESALRQDGCMADRDRGAVVRFSKYDAKSRALVAQYAYTIDPIQGVPASTSAFRDNGVSEILALGENRLLVLERSGVAEADGFHLYIRLYEADTQGATPLGAAGLNPGTYQPMRKQRVFDSRHPALVPGGRHLDALDNVEGMTFGPKLKNGHKSLVLVSDNNFNRHGPQKTQFLVFEVCTDRACTE